jgi:serine/threonine protein kinase
MADGGEAPAPGTALATADALATSDDPMLVRAQARLGTVLRDKWRLDSILGVGGMASVYAATHRNGTRAAVKILHPELSVNALSRQRFLSEGHAANAVGHPGAVRILDDDVSEHGSLYLVTELLEGETLEHRRVRLGGRMPEDEVLLAIDQVLAVLVAAHAQGVVHRDLKPENLFLTRTGQIKVLDFGIARLREPVSGTRLTQAGDAMGTPAYMAPEHARGLWDEVDPRSDLWSVGASMFHLLSGSVVHEGRTVNEQLLEAMTRPAAALSTVAPEVSPSVRGVVDRALAFDKRSRWQDAVSMREALRAAYEELHGAPISAAVPLGVNGGPPERSIVRLRGAGAVSDPPAASATEDTTRRRIPWRVPSRLGSKRTALAAGAVAAVLVVAGLAVGFGGSPSHGTTTARAVASAVARPSVTPVSAPLATAVLVEPGPPEMAATDLPIAPSPPEPSAARAGAGGSRRDCDPPFIVDAETHKKRWKLECL